VSCAETIQLIQMLLRLWNQLGPRKCVSDGVRIGATWQIRLNCPCAVAMQPFCQITLTTAVSS